MRNNDIVSCPHCGSRIRFKTRKRAVFASEDVAVVQPVDDTMSVIRFCMVFGKVTVKETDVHVYEKIRILTGRGANTAPYKMCITDSVAVNLITKQLAAAQNSR